MERRLKKDLPFLKANTVLHQQNGSYESYGGKIYYGNLFSASDKGNIRLDAVEKDLIDTIWENNEWFEDAELGEPQWKVENNSIVIYFKEPVCLDRLDSIAKGVYKTLEAHYTETVSKKMNWKDMTEIF